MAHKIKILIVQPEIPHYRYPFFRELQSRFNICLAHSGRSWAELTPEEELLLEEVSFFNILFFQKMKFRKLIGDADILVINGNIRYLSNLVLIIYAVISKTKFIWWGHLHTASTKKSAHFFKKIRLYISTWADFRLFYTAKEAEQFCQLYPSLISSTSGLSNGLDIEEIKKYRKSYDPSDRKYDVIFCGRFTPKSNLLLLLDAIEYSKTPLQVLLIGDGPLKKIVNKRAQAIRNSNIIILPALFREEELAGYFNASKLFVYPGAAGLSIIHGQSYGLPILIHDNVTNQMPETSIVSDWGGGDYFIENDYISLQVRISEMLFDDERLKAFSDAGIFATESYFNAKIMAENFSSVIKSLRLNDIQLNHR